VKWLAVTLVVLGLAVPATARADRRDRTLVLVAPPAVLVDAVRTSLAPWRIRVIVVDAATRPPRAIAEDHQAGFVAIGDDGVLRLYGPTGTEEQQRRMPVGLGAADAAALALTIKTWMRLDAVPAASGGGVTRRRPAPVPAASRWQLAVQAAVGLRHNQGGLDRLHARVMVAAGLHRARVAVVVGVDLGPGVDVDEPDQPARWTERIGFARASYRLGSSRRLALRPTLGLSLIDGSIAGVRRGNGERFAMSATRLGLDGALQLGWRSGPWGLHVVAGATAVSSSVVLRDRRTQYELPAHVEPWAMIGADANF